jgi:porin
MTLTLRSLATKRRNVLFLLSTLMLISIFSSGQLVLAQESGQVQRLRSGYDNVPEFGGPNSVGRTLKEDDVEGSELEGFKKFFEPYFGFKEWMNKEYGLAFSFDYTTMYQGASDSLEEDTAAGGIFRFYGSWTLLGRDSGNTGSLIYKVENRHRLGTDIVPTDLGFEIGYVGFTAPIYANYDWSLTNLYWQQKFNNDRFNIVAGIVDVTDYLDIYGLINPWTAFSNLAFLTDPTIPAPNQGLGAAFGVMATDNIYAVAGLADTNGDPTKPGDMFDSFFSDNEYFSHIEIGWVSSYDRRYFNNIHVTAWHADERMAAATPDGWGVALSATKIIDDKWMPFLRVGYAEDGGALYERSVSTGIGRYWSDTKNLLGFGLNWSRPSESSFGPNLDDQWTAELFYRWQVAQQIAITPDVQFLKNPAYNPAEDKIWVLGLRGRLNL